MRRRCIRCRAVGRVHEHHVLFRDAIGLYPELLASLCARCHQGLHRLLQRALLESVTNVTPVVTISRIITFLAWMSWQWPERPDEVSLPVSLMSQLVAVMEVQYRALEEASSLTAHIRTVGIVAGTEPVGVLRVAPVAATCRRCGEAHFETELADTDQGARWLLDHLIDVHGEDRVLRIEPMRLPDDDDGQPCT